MEFRYEGSVESGFVVINTKDVVPEEPTKAEPKPELPGSNQEPQKPVSVEPTPKTGDDTNLSLWVLMLLVAGGIALIIGKRINRNWTL